MRQACMLDIICNAVEDEYLTGIMYLLCSIPMRFSGKTSQMIHNKGNHVRSRTPYDAPTPECRPTQQGCSWRVYATPTNRSGADSRWPSGKRPGRTDPAVYRAGLLYLCRAWEWAEDTPFSQSAPHPVTSPPNQRPAQRRV